jgi:hypothetical protein
MNINSASQISLVSSLLISSSIGCRDGMRSRTLILQTGPDHATWGD